MMISIRDFFKSGEIWSNLESTILAMKDRLNCHSDGIKELQNKNLILLQSLNQLDDENKQMRDRLSILEQRMWDLKVVSSSDSAAIVGNQSLPTTHALEKPQGLSRSKKQSV